MVADPASEELRLRREAEVGGERPAGIRAGDVRTLILPDRFWAKVNFDGPVPDYDPSLGPCWLWTASRDGKGYGKFYLHGRLWPAHRLAYEQIIGPITPSFELDHLCRVRECARATHSEQVTHQVNVLRGESRSAEQATRMHCKQGHPLSGENVYIETTRKGTQKRHCKECGCDHHRARNKQGYGKRYYATNRESIRRYAKGWLAANPQKAAEYTQRWRDKKAAA